MPMNDPAFVHVQKVAILVKAGRSSEEICRELDIQHETYRRYFRQAKQLGLLPTSATVNGTKGVLRKPKASQFDTPEETALTKDGWCRVHPSYRGVKAPLANCTACWAIYRRRNGKTVDGELPKDEQIEFLRARTNELESQNARMRKAIGEQREIRDGIVAAIKATPPYPAFSVSHAKGRPSAIPVITFSDWHVGAMINPDETEGFGIYNYEIAQSRLFSILDSFLRWVDAQRNAYALDECTIFGLGDYISGDIHDELRVTNEFPIPVQTARAGLLLGEVIKRIASCFKRVTVYEVGADNHGRLVRKPQCKQKYQNSMSFLVHAMANEVARPCENVEIIEAQGMKHLASVGDYKFLLEHGDTVKAWMGIGYYGINRERGREAMRRMNTEKGFHYQGIGHWHVPGFIEGVTLINGSLSGTDEYDHSEGRHALPSQLAYLVGTHGVFNIVPFTQPTE